MNSKKILLVDDEQELLRTASYILRSNQYEIDKALNGEEALQKIQRARREKDSYQLIITDIQMPKMTGKEMITLLRKEDNETPVLVMTSYGDKDLLKELIHLSRVEYIDKPFNQIDFIHLVNKIFLDLEKEDKKQRDSLESVSREKEILKSEKETLSRNITTLSNEIESALAAYKNLISINTDQCPVRFVYRHRPYNEFGGDFLNIKPFGSECRILMADVAGHDMGATYHHIVIKTLFDQYFQENASEDLFLNYLNTAIYQSYNHDRLVTALFVNINLKTMKAEIFNAGHPALIHIPVKTHLPQTLEAPGMTLGLFQDCSFGKSSVSLQPKDRIILFTDGLTNAARKDGESGELFQMKAEGISRLAAQYSGEDMEDMIDVIWKEVLSFCRYKPTDDMMLAGIEIPEVPHVQH